jgi:hypothetical protein
MRVADPDAAGPERRARPFELRSTHRAARRRWIQELAPASGDGCGPDAARVLELFGGEPHDGRLGTKDGSWVWVARPDAPPASGALQEACAHAADEGIDELYVLAWEWGTLDLGKLRTRMVERFGVRVLPRSIPAEAIQPGIRRRGLHFYAHPEIEIETRASNGAMSLRLAELRWAEPPEELAEGGGDPASWQELMASWALDSYRQNATFEPSWHSHRGRKGQGLVLETPQRPSPRRGGRRSEEGALSGGEVMVKVLTVFGDEVVRELLVP